MKWVLRWQGLYYALTGVWAILDIQNFSNFTNYQGDFFLKHVNALLFLALGVVLLARSFGSQLSRGEWALFLGFTTFLAVIEAVYLPRIGFPWAFYFDFWEHLGIAVLTITLRLRGKNSEDAGQNI